MRRRTRTLTSAITAALALGLGISPAIDVSSGAIGIGVGRGLATTTGSGPLRTSTFVLGFHPGSGKSEQRQVLAAFGLEVVRRVPHLDQVLVRPHGPPVDTGRLLATDAVASVSDLGRFQAAALPAPRDPGFAKQWNLPMIEIPSAWEVSRGTGAIVAVLDTGVAFEDYGPYKKAPDLAGTTFVAGYDFVDNDDHPNDDIDPLAADRPAHGTHTTGIIAETADNGIGGVGVAPGASIMPVRVLDPTGGGDDDRIAAGIVFAVDHGAQVLNMSFDSPAEAPMTKAAVTYAASKGVTMVAASGNTGRAVVGYPAAYPEVLAVGAVRIDRTRPAYSSYGALGDVDLVAPGGDLSVDQDGDGHPDGILSHSMVYATNSFGE